MRYVVGFLFNPSMDKVVLIQKNRPEWQAGKYNGIGGKVEPGEGFQEAITREFGEETGVTLDLSAWKRFATIHFPEAELQVFYAVSGLYTEVRTITDEEVDYWDVDYVMESWRKDIIPNVRWLIQMALSFGLGERAEEFIIHEVYNE